MTIQTIRQFFLKRKNKIALLFFPREAKGDRRDAVRVFHNYITDRHKRLFWYKMFEELHYNCYAEVFGDLNPRKIPKSIILFAHTIRLKWWKCNIKYNWLFAHVCKGAEILDLPESRDVFPNWLSYSDDIKIFVASEKGESCWRSVTHSILEEIPKSKSIKSMKERMLAIYYNAMAELDDTRDPRAGDSINLMCLENCIQNMKTS